MANEYYWKVWLRPNLLTKDDDNDYVAEVLTESLIMSIIALVLPEPLVPTISLIIVLSSCIFHASRREIVFCSACSYFSFASSSAVRFS